MVQFIIGLQMVQIPLKQEQKGEHLISFDKKNHIQLSMMNLQKY